MIRKTAPVIPGKTPGVPAETSGGNDRQKKSSSKNKAEERFEDHIAKAEEKLG